MFSVDAGDIFTRGWWIFRRTIIVRDIHCGYAYVTPYPDDRKSMANVVSRASLARWRKVKP